MNKAKTFSLSFTGIECATLNVDFSIYATTQLSGSYGDAVTITCNLGYSTRPATDDLLTYPSNCSSLGLWTNIGHCESKWLHLVCVFDILVCSIVSFTAVEILPEF